MLVPLGYFSDILRFVQMLKIEWGAESNEKLPHLFIPSKTLNLGSWVCGGRPAFGQNCSLRAWVCSEKLALGAEHSDYYEYDINKSMEGMCLYVGNIAIFSAFYFFIQNFDDPDSFQLLMTYVCILLELWLQRWPAHALCAGALFPAHVHDVRAERSKRNKEGMEGKEVRGLAACLC